MIEAFRRVLFLGAHPDDEMGCAGLLYQLRCQGSEVRVITFSKCEDFNGPSLIDEWREALAVLGINGLLATDPGRPIVPETYLLGWPNRRLHEHRQEILEVLDLERTRNLDLVLCPSTSDAHQDHATVAAEARRAFKDTTVLGYELPLNQVGASALGAYVALSPKAMEAKVAHAAAFRSQADKPYMSADYIEALARVRGVQSGARWAEAFEVIRWVM